eukprot:3734182-Amphidinium_carterae.1
MSTTHLPMLPLHKRRCCTIKALWTRAAHADLKFDSGWFEKVQHGHDGVCVSLSELIPTDDPHLIVADTSSPEPTSCGLDARFPPPKLLMDRILQQLEKIDMPRDHGRSKDLQNVKCPRSKLLGLYVIY